MTWSGLQKLEFDGAGPGIRDPLRCFVGECESALLLPSHPRTGGRVLQTSTLEGRRVRPLGSHSGIRAVSHLSGRRGLRLDPLGFPWNEKASFRETEEATPAPKPAHGAPGSKVETREGRNPGGGLGELAAGPSRWDGTWPPACPALQPSTPPGRRLHTTHRGRLNSPEDG